MPTPKVTVFVDYQNAHLSAHHHWCDDEAKVHECLIDPVKLAEQLVAKRAPGGVVEAIRVYRGRPDARKQPEAAKYSDRAASAWERDTRVTVLRRPLKYPTNWGEPGAEPAREKGIDVQLAVDLVRMGLAHEYEVGILFSRDTDLLPALELIFQRGGAHTEVATWEGKSRLALPNWKLHCHTLDRKAFDACRDTRNYDYVLPAYVPKTPQP